MTVEQAKALVQALRDAIAKAQQDGVDTIDLKGSLSDNLGASLDDLEAAIAEAKGG